VYLLNHPRTYTSASHQCAALTHRHSDGESFFAIMASNLSQAGYSKYHQKFSIASYADFQILLGAG
jgi:hypothetical protein